MKILLVCLGNICRSPMGEGILRNEVTGRNLDWEIDSSGTGAWHVGEAPDIRARRKSKEKGIDISNLSARQFTQDDFDKFDVILVMDHQNKRDVLKLARDENDRKKVELILEYSHPGQNLSVPDPYWNDDGFEQVYQLLKEASEKFIEKHT